jgi:hypothetical protein
MSNENDPNLQQMALVHQELRDELQEQELAYQRAQRYGDVLEQRNASYRMIDAKTRLRELDQTYNEYQASKNPPRPPELTAEQKLAQPWDQCSWADTYEWASKSKYGCDPEGFRRGMEEVQKRPSSKR